MAPMGNRSPIVRYVLLAIGWLLRYVSKNSFRGFAVYRIIAGLVILTLSYLGYLQTAA